MGVLPDGLRLFERLSGPELLSYLGRLRGMPLDVVTQRSAELIRVLDLDDAGNKLVADYSTGMRKKITLAAALLHSPSVLLLDEPLEAVDPARAAVSSRRSTRRVRRRRHRPGSSNVWNTAATAAIPDAKAMPDLPPSSDASADSRAWRFGLRVADVGKARGIASIGGALVSGRQLDARRDGACHRIALRGGVDGKGFKFHGRIVAPEIGTEQQVRWMGSTSAGPSSTAHRSDDRTTRSAIGCPRRHRRRRRDAPRCRRPSSAGCRSRHDGSD